MRTRIAVNATFVLPAGEAEMVPGQVAGLLQSTLPIRSAVPTTRLAAQPRQRFPNLRKSGLIETENLRSQNPIRRVHVVRLAQGETTVARVMIWIELELESVGSMRGRQPTCSQPNRESISLFVRYVDQVARSR